MTFSDAFSCLTTRMALARHLLDKGQWAAAHAMAAGSLRCANLGSCSRGDECRCAADALLEDLRGLMAE